LFATPFCLRISFDFERVERNCTNAFKLGGHVATPCSSGNHTNAAGALQLIPIMTIDSPATTKDSTAARI